MKNKITAIITATVMVIMFIPTFSFAGEATELGEKNIVSEIEKEKDLSNNINSSSVENNIEDPVSLINNIKDEYKKDLIIKLFEPICVTVESEECIAGDGSDETIKTIKRLINMTNSELEQELSYNVKKLTTEAQEIEGKVFFTEEGINIVQEYCPEDMNKVNAINNKMKYDKEINYKDVIRRANANKLYKKSNTLGYTCAEGRAFSLTVNIEWVVNIKKKITSKSTSASTWNNGLWTRKELKKTKDTIDSRGFGNISWRTRFQHKVGMPVIKTINNGAWFYADGGCDWN